MACMIHYAIVRWLISFVVTTVCCEHISLTQQATGPGMCSAQQKLTLCHTSSTDGSLRFGAVRCILCVCTA